MRKKKEKIAFKMIKHEQNRASEGILEEKNILISLKFLKFNLAALNFCSIREWCGSYY